jgi:hypothetical protein
MQKQTGYALLLPVAGAVLFVLLYCLAAFNYPGGSQADNHSKGFSWLHNYWCNLLNERSINGDLNPGRPYALAGMLVLCLSLGWFWYCFAFYVPLKTSQRTAMQFSGALSMCIAFFIFTSLHTIVINIAGAIAVVSLVFTFMGLRKMKWRKLFAFGLVNLALVILNNGLYYGGGLRYLPVVQKITFLLFLSWICMISIVMYHAVQKNNAGVGT